MKGIKEVIKSFPILKTLVVNAKVFFGNKTYIKDSKAYWIERYGAGGNSGPGSYNKFAEFKAEVLNDFVLRNNIKKIVELGCGDGNQLQYFNFPEYVGYDVSPDALKLCREKFGNTSSKSFKLIDNFNLENADLALSLDVIYHLIEDDVFNDYMNKLFQSSKKYVIIYASNSTELNISTNPHVKHRKFTNWVKANRPAFSLIEVVPNKYPYQGDYKEGSFADFYIYQLR